MSMQSRTEMKAMPRGFFMPIQSRFLQRKCACGGSPGVDGECAECRAKRLSLQRNATNPSTPSTVPPIVHDVLRSPGQPLDAGTRVFMEPRFGHDFSHVRVHTDANAAESALAVNALAYTVGRNVVFGPGQYAPETRAGQKLLAHEMTHVVQQQSTENSSDIQKKLTLSGPNDTYEQEANLQADRVMEGYSLDAPKVKGKLTVARLQRKIDSAKALVGSGCRVSTSSFGGAPRIDLTFAKSSEELSEDSKRTVQDFVDTLSDDKSGSQNHIRIDGFASTDGDETFNLLLSCKRAKAVKRELVTQGISEGRVIMFAHGETSEFSGKDLEENRRAVISTTIAPCSPGEAKLLKERASEFQKTGLKLVQQASHALDLLHSRWIDNKTDILGGRRKLEGGIVCAFNSNFNIDQRDPNYGVRHIQVALFLKHLQGRLGQKVDYTCQPDNDPICKSNQGRDTFAYVVNHQTPVRCCKPFKNSISGSSIEAESVHSTIIHEVTHLIGTDDAGGYAFGGLGAAISSCQIGQKFTAQSDVLVHTADALTGFVMNVEGKEADIRVR